MSNELSLVIHNRNGETSNEQEEFSNRMNEITNYRSLSYYQYVQLPFWFTSMPKYPEIQINYNDIDNTLNTIDTINTFDELVQLTEKYSNLAIKFINITHDSFSLDLGIYLGPKITPYDNLLKKINQKIESYYPKYKEIIIFKNTECANGFQLYNVTENLFLLADFIELKKMFENNKPMTYVEFRAEFGENACTEWHKMDEHGNSFGGFWLSDEPVERDDAFNLQFEENCKMLYELPYSNKLKLWTINYGCRNRLESVRYSNFLCCWLQWKIYQMDEHMKQIDKKYQTAKIKNIIKNISMEPSRIYNWFLSEDDKQYISNTFDVSINVKRPLIEIIKEQELKY